MSLQGQDDDLHPEVVGFDIYRRTHGACPDQPVRITGEPLARVLGQGFNLGFVDPNVSDGTLYYYQVYGVDAQRTTLTSLYTLYSPGSNDSNYGGCGRTLLGYGTLADEGWAWSFQPCPGSCFETALVVAGLPALEPYVGSGTPLALYGGFAWSVEGHMMIVEEFELRSCTTSVETQTWGHLKQLYKDAAR